MDKRFCKYCGKEFSPTVFRNGKTEHYSMFIKRKYCSYECSWESKIKDPTSETDYINRLYYKLRVSRDKNICEHCDSVKKLCNHHVDGNIQNNKSSNLMTLCMSCHTKLHSYKRPYNQDVLKSCVICGVKASSLNLCRKHAARFRKYGDPFAIKKGNGFIKDYSCINNDDLQNKITNNTIIRKIQHELKFK